MLSRELVVVRRVGERMQAERWCPRLCSGTQGLRLGSNTRPFGSDPDCRVQLCDFGKFTQLPCASVSLFLNTVKRVVPSSWSCHED